MTDNAIIWAISLRKFRNVVQIKRLIYFVIGYRLS